MIISMAIALDHSGPENAPLLQKGLAQGTLDRAECRHVASPRTEFVNSLTVLPSFVFYDSSK